VLSQLFREILAPQKYRCETCHLRWLAWPPLFRRFGTFSKLLRWLRRLVSTRGEWTPPSRDEGTS
jgi:hypothetical protein